MIIKESIYIFGAHTRAQNLYAYFKELFPETKVKGFLYDNEESNPVTIDNIPVHRLDAIENIPAESEIWVATKSVYFEKVIRNICKKFSGKIVCVTPQIDNELRNLYVKKIFASKGMSFYKITDLFNRNVFKTEEKPVVYMVKSVYDQKIQEEILPSIILPIQAGASLTKDRIAEMTDCVGENISYKNRQYCELTVLYWMWKNATASWVGLCHYRRHFVITDEEIAWLPSSGIDVVLPVPSICQPSIGDNYRKRHDAADWEYLMKVLHNSYDDFYDLAVRLWETGEFGNLYYTCNMFIMKKQVLDEYCEWLFPILEEMERFGGEKEDTYQNRYLGFLAERLMTLYFVYYKDKYRIAYVDKRFIMK